VQFCFDEEQLLFQESVRGMLAKECPPERLRALSTSETGRSPELWAKLGEIGLLGLLVPEDHLGLGLTEVDAVLALEETGRAALGEPVVETACIAARMMAEVGHNDLASRWLPAIATGEAIVAVGHPQNPFVTDAHVADLLLLPHGDEIHAVERGSAKLTHQPSIDPLRRLYTVEWKASPSTRVAAGDRARHALAAAYDRGAWATGAQQVGIARGLVDAAVKYSGQREQFGQLIGTFQALKHMLASVAVKIEFARPVLQRAAFAIANDTPDRVLAASHAKAAASEAAAMAAKAALQVHGAIGYTWEVDLHLWMKRAWSLDQAWGSAASHRARIADRILGDAPAPSFGFSAR
jgi:alkylation response protein AidB-like acyl-CoA dehydrogenase